MTRRAVTREAEHVTGVRIIDTADVAAKAFRPRVLFGNPLQVADRWAYACGRIKRIMTEGVRDRAYVGACGPLAKEYATLWTCYYLTRNVAPEARGFARNQFDGMSERDAARAFMRGVEDICDRSTGVLGSWYTR